MAAEKKRGRPPGSKNKTTSKAKTSSSGGKSKSTTSKAKPKTKSTEAYIDKVAGSRLRDEIWSIVIMAVGIFLVISLQTSAAGKLGSGIHFVILGTFGWVGYLLPYYMIVYGLLMFRQKLAHITLRSIVFFIVIFLCVSIMNAAQFLDGQTYTFNMEYVKSMFLLGQAKASGGAFGMSIGLILVKVIGIMGLYIFSIALIIISVMLITKTPLSHHLDVLKAKKAMRREMEEDEEEARMAYYEEEEEEEEPARYKMRQKIPDLSKENKKGKKSSSQLSGVTYGEHQTSLELKSADYAPPVGGMSHGQKQILSYMVDDTLFERPSEQQQEIIFEDSTAPTAPREEVREQESLQRKVSAEPLIEQSKEAQDSKIENKPENKTEAATTTLSPEEMNLKAATPVKPYKLPPIDLLNPAPVDKNAGKGESLQAKAAKLEQTFKDFNVNAKVVQVTKGPAVTRFEIQPGTGVKVNSIVRLSDDIALNLEAKSIRIEAPIPGKAAVGIEVENESINMVTLREIIDSKNFKEASSKITFSVGKDISGNAITADLKTMPHMLIAGSTGSGKSVCINSIIISMLYKSKPEEVKFVLIDPKVVELGNYNGIPHLLIPVVTDPGKAAAALNWAVAEMTDRYKKFAEEGVRDLASFNSAVKKKKEDERYMPQIVIIIDELADLMMAAPSQVEESICRLAQMARAAGMHLIVATQRPSVDVITGVIKANIPSRIAFAVSSQFDSRTILDMGGAEKLVGKGDMLFNPLGMAKPIRVQGTFISDKEVNSVIEFVKGQMEGEAEYASEVIHSIEKVSTNAAEEEEDALLSEAIETVVKSKQASVSMLQRRFRIGYNRAARLVDMMESRGIIGPADGSRPRQVFLTEEEMLAMDEKLDENQSNDKSQEIISEKEKEIS